ncbi:MAG: hypothetical protein OXH76_08640, partial [Boseongicola sp.]|nr:hypothetical protein [Boseongicola sp.]
AKHAIAMMVSGIAQAPDVSCGLMIEQPKRISQARTATSQFFSLGFADSGSHAATRGEDEIQVGSSR